MISKKERKELDELSKNVFGSSSRWQKLMGKGYTELVTKEVVETVPPEKEGDEPTTKTVQVPVKTEFGADQYVVKYHTVESVKKYMEEQKELLENIRSQIQKLQEDQIKLQEEQKKQEQNEKIAKEINKQMGGSAK